MSNEPKVNTTPRLNTDISLYYKPDQGKSHGRLFVMYQDPKEGRHLLHYSTGSLEQGIAAVLSTKATIWQKIGKFFGLWKEHQLVVFGNETEHSFLLNTRSLTKRVSDLAKTNFNQAINEQVRVNPKGLELDFMNRDITKESDTSLTKAFVTEINSKPDWINSLFTIDIKDHNYLRQLVTISQRAKNLNYLIKYCEETGSDPTNLNALKEQLKLLLLSQKTINQIRGYEGISLSSEIANLIKENLTLNDLITAIQGFQNQQGHKFTRPLKILTCDMEIASYNSFNALYNIMADMISKDIGQFLESDVPEYLQPALKKALLEDDPRSRQETRYQLTDQAKLWVENTQLTTQQSKNIMNFLGNEFNKLPKDLLDSLVKSPKSEDNNPLFVPIHAYQIEQLMIGREVKAEELSRVIEEISRHPQKNAIIRTALDNFITKNRKDLAVSMLDRFAKIENQRDYVSQLLKEGDNYAKYLDYGSLYKFDRSNTLIYKSLTDICREFYKDLDFLASNTSFFTDYDRWLGDCRVRLIDEVKLALNSIMVKSQGGLNESQKKQIYDVVTNIPEIFQTIPDQNMKDLLKSMLILDLKHDGNLAKAFARTSPDSYEPILVAALEEISDPNCAINIITNFPIRTLTITDDIKVSFDQFMKQSKVNSIEKMQRKTVFESLLKEAIKNNPSIIDKLPEQSRTRIGYIIVDFLNADTDGTFLKSLIELKITNLGDYLDHHLQRIFDNLISNSGDDINLDDNTIRKVQTMLGIFSEQNIKLKSTLIDEFKDGAKFYSASNKFEKLSDQLARHEIFKDNNKDDLIKLLKKYFHQPIS